MRAPTTPSRVNLHLWQDKHQRRLIDVIIFCTSRSFLTSQDKETGEIAFVRFNPMGQISSPYISLPAGYRWQAVPFISRSRIFAARAVSCSTIFTLGNLSRKSSHCIRPWGATSPHQFHRWWCREGLPRYVIRSLCSPAIRR